MTYATDPISESIGSLYGEIVFVRQESNGSLNIHPCSITCNNWERLTLKGGEAASIFLKKGEYEFQAFSSEPYEKDSDPTSCRSASLVVKIETGKKLFVEVIPKSAEGEIRFHWIIKEKNSK